MSGALQGFAVTWIGLRLPEVVVSSGALDALSRGDGRLAGLDALLAVAHAAAVDPDPARHHAEKIGEGSFALRFQGIDLVIAGGDGAPLVVLLPQEFPTWAADGLKPDQALAVDPVQALARLRARRAQA